MQSPSTCTHQAHDPEGQPARACRQQLRHRGLHGHRPCRAREGKRGRNEGRKDPPTRKQLRHPGLHGHRPCRAARSGTWSPNPLCRPVPCGAREGDAQNPASRGLGLPTDTAHVMMRAQGGAAWCWRHPQGLPGPPTRAPGLGSPWTHGPNMPAACRPAQHQACPHQPPAHPGAGWAWTPACPCWRQPPFPGRRRPFRSWEV
jgi:hypothetical protein